MTPASMTLTIYLPSGIFCETPEVARIVADTRDGSLGLLPHRLDCVAALAPGILVVETRKQEETYVAVDDGVLVKTGLDVRVSVRDAIGSADLAQLHAAVEARFVRLGAEERSLRAATAKMESGFVRRLAELSRE